MYKQMVCCAFNQHTGKLSLRYSRNWIGEQPALEIVLLKVKKKTPKRRHEFITVKEINSLYETMLYPTHTHVSESSLRQLYPFVLCIRVHGILRNIMDLFRVFV